jgi:hypothetical protein
MKAYLAARKSSAIKEGMAKAGYGKTEQAERTQAFHAQVRAWYFKELERYADHVSRLGVPPLQEIGSTVCGMHEYGGCWGKLTHDHVGTRNQKDPAESQTLCYGHNSAKGSKKGKVWDFREERFKEWLIEARDRDWIWNALHSEWEPRV